MKFDLKKFLKNLKLNEENISMAFGILVILVISVLIVNYFKDKKGEVAPAGQTQNLTDSSSYAVKEGDSLWKIADEKLGDGFKWEDIKKLNNLNSNTIEVGQKLIIPEKSIMTGGSDENKTPETYTVVKGDTLWDISVFVYGDGARWSEIAKLNNLKNPNLIHAGNVLKLPR